MNLVHSIPEACALACAGRTAIYEAINAGELIAHKRGKRTLIFAGDLQRWLDSLPQIEVKRSVERGFTGIRQAKTREARRKDIP